MRSFIEIAFLLLFSLLMGTRGLQGQAVPAGLIYQAAIEGGIDYLSPQVGQAIINQKAALNWKVIAAHMLTDGSIGVLTAGLTGVIHMSTVWKTALVAGHEFADKEAVPLLQAGAPNPNDIPPVLAMNGSMNPSPSACVENSIYASNAKRLKAVINGIVVTFSPQLGQVMRHIDGSKLKQVQALDVLACVPGITVLPPPVPVPSAPSAPAGPGPLPVPKSDSELRGIPSPSAPVPWIVAFESQVVIGGME
jgi:hypothetical protein